MKVARIEAGTPDPPGGQIQKDDSGNPTGILFEKAMKMVSDRMPRPGVEQVVKAIQEAQPYCLRAGLTGIHDYDDRKCFQAIQQLRTNGRLHMRVVKNFPVKRLNHLTSLGLASGFGDDWIRIGSIKVYTDGALGPRSASMISPYEGEADNFGLIVTDKEELMSAVIEASRSGLSVAVHAIGDKANHDVLDVFEAAASRATKRSNIPDEPTNRMRHRIEHAQLLHPDDINRLASLGVIASMQPIHATSDMEMVDRYWGDRSQYAYAWRSLLESGATLTFGSDAPVESIEPLLGIHAAVTRRRVDGAPGSNGWVPDQRLTVEEAVTGYTMGAAIASNRERTMGSIAPGKLADLTILEGDIFAIPPDEIAGVSVAGTIVDGEFKFRNW
jgi:predicted amidohydrolase YtcJ